MQLRFRYIFSDYAEANVRHFWLNRLTTIAWFVVTPLLVTGFIVIAVDESRDYSIVSYIPVLVFWGLVSPWGKRLLVYMRWKHQPTLQSEIGYEISDAIVVITSETSRSEMKWETFTRFRESKNLFILYAGRYLIYMIPKRSFEAEAELAEFRELAQRRVPAKK